jgi:hypothetical protein
MLKNSMPGKISGKICEKMPENLFGKKAEPIACCQTNRQFSIFKWSLSFVSFLFVGVFLSGCIAMNSAEPSPNAYPQQVRFSTERSDVHYERSTAYALHYSQPDSAPPEALMSMEDGTIAIFPQDSQPVSRSPDATLTPVYTLEPGNVMAVPTGLVLVRFQKGTIAADHHADLQEAGYAIESSPPYAPHTAWLRSSGSIADALSGIPRLEAIPGVENVEPQMIVERRFREGVRE